MLQMLLIAIIIVLAAVIVYMNRSSRSIIISLLQDKTWVVKREPNKYLSFRKVNGDNVEVAHKIDGGEIVVSQVKIIDAGSSGIKFLLNDENYFINLLRTSSYGEKSARLNVAIVNARTGKIYSSDMVYDSTNLLYMG
jgi:hypothetical protein